MSDRVLLVDDDQSILAAQRRNLRGRFDVATATDAESALAKLAESGPFAAVVSDLAMPGMDGVEFLGSLVEQYPDTIRILLTGNPDVDVASRAISEGKVFRFLTKPCASSALLEALEDAVSVHHAKTAEREVLERTLGESINVLMELLALLQPEAYRRAKRVRLFARRLCDETKRVDRWELDTAAMLSQIGLVALPPELTERWRAGERLSADEQELIDGQARAGAELIERIPRMENVAALLRASAGKNGLPKDADRELRRAAYLLRLATTFVDELESGTALEAALTRLGRIAARTPKLLTALAEEYSAAEQLTLRHLGLEDLRAGMHLAEPVLSNAGQLLLSGGHEVTAPLLARLRSLRRTVGIREPVVVRAA